MKSNNTHLSLEERIKRLGAAPKTGKAHAPPGLTSNQIRVVVAIERAVARLEAETSLREHLIFKGGFVLLKTIESARFTRDLDALAFDIDQEKAAELIKKALTCDLEDSLWFVDIQTETIPDQGDYGGLRLNCAFQIGKAAPESAKIKKLSRIHIDIGFGDEVPEQAKQKIQEMPSVLGSDPVSWRVYPLEFIFAEKLQTLIMRGSSNSRAKDVYDLAEIFPKCGNRPVLVRAIRLVFKNRKTSLPENIAETVGRFDRGVLSAAWGSVDVSGSAPTFEDCWNRLLTLLHQLAEDLKT